MKKLETASGTAPLPYFKRRSGMNEKELLIDDIGDFIGDGGRIPMEHGYRPTLNVSEFTRTGMRLRFPIGREHRTDIPYAEMDTTMLRSVIVELFRYRLYCEKYA